MSKTWIDCPDEPIGDGDYCRKVRPHDVPTVYIIEDIRGDWATFTPVKTDGTRDRRWYGGYSGGIEGYVRVRKASEMATA